MPEISATEKDVRILPFIEYLFMFLLLLQSHSVYSLSDGPIPNVLRYLFFGVIFVSVFIYLIKTYNIVSYYKFIIFSLVMLTYLLILWLINYYKYPYGTGELNRTIFQSLAFVIPFVFIIYNSFILKTNILDKLKNLILILCLFSLFFWALGLAGVPTNDTFSFTWGIPKDVPSYFNIYFFAQDPINFFGLNLVRNTSIFVEAPMFAYVITIGLFISLFISNDRIISKEVILLIITMITTTSTTGVIIMILAILFKYFLNNKNINIFKVLIYIGFLFIVLLIVYMLVVNKQSDSTNSLSTRIDDFNIGFDAWMLHPFIGNGIGNYNIILSFMDFSRTIIGGNSGFSSGFMIVLAEGGILALLYYLLPLLLSLKLNKKIFVMSLLLFIVFIFTLVDGMYLYIFMIAYIISKYLEKIK